MAKKSGRNVPVLTIGILILFIILFLLDYLLLSPETVKLFSMSHLILGETGGGTLSRMLSMSPAEVRAGEVWRIFTYPFLHAGLLRLVLSAVAFYILGSVIEPYIGKLKLLLAFLITGAFSALIMLRIPSFAGALGAAPALHGLLGVFAALLLKSGRSFSGRVGKIHWLLIFLLAASNVFWGQDLLLANMAGFSGGVLLSLALFHKKTV
ncbi:MAG: rhomboid family intramembrane serine protease [Oscillospiraceae bacterium]|jgi:rhomboid protease GluP|nr:rhomboid family intramembrane serine protease [Oscillospiraceae bacterium]